MDVRVLHIDDEPEFAQTGAAFLEREYDGVAVETTTNPTEALDLIEQHEFDCIVADSAMSKYDGIEFLQALRKDHPDLPVIFYTGKGSEEIASTAIAEGVTDHVPKSLDSDIYPLLADRIMDAVGNRRAQDSYEQIFEAIPDGIVIHDPETFEFVDMNRRYVDMYGYDSKEDFLEAGFDAIHVDDPPYTMERAEEHVRNAINCGPHTFDWPAVRKDGSEFWAEVHLSPIQLTGRRRILAVVRDVTERVEYENELERTNERLDEFASIVSHDLRNPLTVAEGYVELMRGRYDDEDLERIARAHSRMRNLIDDMLTLTRGEVTTDREELPLHDLARLCWENVRTEGAELVVEIEQRVLADRSRLQQLLENLFRNAVEHAGGSPTITVGQLANGFYVEDDGRGIPEDRREDIFELGYTTSDTGTGYGLNIVREVADDHGWEITVTESDDGGARFEFAGVESTAA